MKNWDKILDDFAHRCGDGGPDMTNPRHLALLRESLIKFGWKENATNEFIGNLREGEEKDYKGKGARSGSGTKSDPYKYDYSEPSSETGGETEDDGEGDAKPDPSMSQANIDLIDGDAKKGGKDGTVKAPGNPSSVINEIGVGDGMGHLSQNPNLTVDELEELLFKDMSTTAIGRKNGASKTKNACRAAAKSAKREFERTQQTVSNQKDSKGRKMNPKETKVSHVWGSKESLQNTVDHLEKLGVKEVNGIPFDPDYKKIILEGGAGENPTDTMVVMIDDSQDPPVCAINHTSNKTSSNDIQGNSSPEKNGEAIRKQAAKDLTSGKIDQKQYDYVVQQTTQLESSLSSVQKKIDTEVQKTNAQLRAKLPTQLIDDLKVASKKTGGGTSAKYWGKAVLQHQMKIKPPLNPKRAAKDFNADTGDYDPPLTPEEEQRIAASFVKEMEDASNGVAGAVEPTGDMNKALVRVVDTTQMDAELKKLYQEQHKLITDNRNDLNKKIKTKPPLPKGQGYGDYTASKNFLNRLHLNVVEGHDPGGIPKENFEVNCGNNDSELFYDENGNEYQWTSKGFLRTPLKKDKQGKITGGADNKPPIKGKKKSLDAGTFDTGDNAVVINEENIAKCLGVTPPAKDIAEHIVVSDVESSSGVTGNVTIYDLNGRIIGEQSVRPKGGKGTKVQDTVKFHPSFQRCLQKESK
jgi:hypothetical protein